MDYPYRLVLFITLVLSVSVDATAQQPLPQTRVPYKLPEMIELEPSPLSEIAVSNFSVLELNGAYEVYFGINIALGEVGGFYASGISYEIDLDEKTYILTAKDPLDIVPGPAGFLSQESELTLNSSKDGVTNFDRTLQTNPNTSRSGTTVAKASGNSTCEETRRVFLEAKIETQDPVNIVLARTTQSLAWNANLCAGELTSVRRYYYGNPDTIPWAGRVSTNWFEIDSQGSSSPLFLTLSQTYATSMATYQNDNFLGPIDIFGNSTWAYHNIAAQLIRRYVYLDFYATHWGYFNWLLKGETDYTFREQF